MFYLIYYKELINTCLLKFFNDFNDYFVIENNCYIFSANYSISKLKTIFKKYIKTEIKTYCKPNKDIFQNDYYLVIGGCLPKDNILLQYKDLQYFPEKLNKLILNEHQIKYILKEQDIKLNIIQINEIFIELFNEFFNNKLTIGKQYNNIIFIQHKRLDCYLLFKTLKFLLGNKNCVNLYEKYFKNNKQCIIAINDKIQQYIHNKNLLNSNNEYKIIVNEIKQYLDEIIFSV